MSPSPYSPLPSSPPQGHASSRAGGSALQLLHRLIPAPLRRRWRAFLFLALCLIPLATLSINHYLDKLYHIPPNHRQNLARLHALPFPPLAWLLEPYREGYGFSEGIASILAPDNPPLAAYKCAPLHGDASPHRAASGFDGLVNPFLLLATFSTAAEFEKRAMLRERRRDGLRREDWPFVQTRFVIGALREQDRAGEAGQALERRLKAEQELWGDLMRLEMEENMDDG